MSTIEWVASGVFLLLILVGFIYGCRGSGDRTDDGHKERSIIGDSAGLGSGGGGPGLGC
jgi:hypothetical protein